MTDRQSISQTSYKHNFATRLLSFSDHHYPEITFAEKCKLIKFVRQVRNPAPKERFRPDPLKQYCQQQKTSTEM